MFLGLISIAALAAWVHMTWFRANFWRAGPLLEAAPAPDAPPPVTILIPARNEADTIGPVISAHFASSYPGDFQILLIDDHSNDGTAERARAAAQLAGADDRLTIINAPDLPVGWTGKLWAQHTGYQHICAYHEETGYVLLCDADIKASPELLSSLIAKAESENLQLVSLMARLDMRGLWASLLMPAFVYFFKMIYPFARVNERLEKQGGAAGGCMLVRRANLDKIDGFKSVRNNLIDDCTLAQALKDGDLTRGIWLGMADSEAVSLRDNRQLGSIWEMIARTAFAQLRFSPILLAGSLLGLAVTFLAPILLVILTPYHGSLLAGLCGHGACYLMARTYVPTLNHYGFPAWRALTLPGAAILYMGMTISSALRHWRGRGGQWKGRVY